MEFLLHNASGFSAAVVSSLVAAVWQGAILAIFVALCMKCFPRLSAAFRSVIWLNVFLVLVLLHIVPYFRGQVGVGQPAHSSPILLRSGFAVAIAGAWVALSLWRSARLILGAYHLQRLVRRALPIVPDESLRALLHGENGSRGAQLCTSMEVERPSVIGFFRPRILLSPALLERLSALELQQVVLHEMEHLHRGDDWSNLIQKIGLTLFPLNPVLYWTEGRLCEERELACDDRVLKSSCTRKSYAMCLTRLAEDSVLRRKLSLALGAWERRSELVSRVQRLLVRPGQSMGSRQAKMVTAGLILAISGGSLALTRSPQLVGFTTMGPSAVHATAVLGTDLHPQGLRGSNVASATGSLQLVKAVMPQSAVQETLKPKLVHAHVVKHAVKPRIARDRQAWLVLTEWNDSLPPAHLVIAVAPGDGNRYAAVPIAHGWLILQI